eukprot:2363071-Prymnesium_polylepis.1
MHLNANSRSGPDFANPPAPWRPDARYCTVNPQITSAPSALGDGVTFKNARRQPRRTPYSCCVT